MRSIGRENSDISHLFPENVLRIRAGGRLQICLEFRESRVLNHLDRNTRDDRFPATPQGSAPDKLSIVLLVRRVEPGWQVAFHRFAEVSTGIAVALVMTVVWPERDAATSNQQGKDIPDDPTAAFGGAEQDRPPRSILLISLMNSICLVPANLPSPSSIPRRITASTPQDPTGGALGECVRHFDLGGGRRQELQENGQQVLVNAENWQTPCQGERRLVILSC